MVHIFVRVTGKGHQFSSLKGGIKVETLNKRVTVVVSLSSFKCFRQLLSYSSEHILIPDSTTRPKKSHLKPEGILDLFLGPATKTQAPFIFSVCWVCLVRFFVVVGHGYRDRFPGKLPTAFLQVQQISLS